MICVVCSGAMKKLIDLPDFCGVDQAFVYCESCSHGSLQTILPQPKDTTMGEKGYLEVFAEFVKERAGTYFSQIIDIGGNDGSLVEMFGGGTVIDPSVNSRIEDADLSGLQGSKLFLSSHTIEHLRYPGQFFGKVAHAMSDQDRLAIQFPSLDLLVEDARIEQIHNQHYHYFSQHSVTSMLARYGLEVVAERFNPDHWGALMLVAKKSQGKARGKQIKDIEVVFANYRFELQMANAQYMLSKPFVCYGASPMLPVWSYHLPLEKAEAVVDDHKSPGGLKGRNVLITAVSKMTARKLVTQAFSRGARNVIVPFHQL